MPQHIGIVAASPEGSAFCYRRIGRRVSEIERRELRPAVTMHNLPFATYVEKLNAGDWEGIAEMLCDSAQTLHAAGADFCILPDNALHHAVPMVEHKCAIRFLNMIDLVAEKVKTDGCKTLGLIGTKFVTFGSTYQTALGLRGMHLLVPSETHVEEIDRIIFTEAVYGRVRPASRGRVVDAITGLADRGCDALILGCSEASLIMAVEDSPLPVVDPVELLAEAAVQQAIGVAQAA